jgi:hypothetical protein
MNMETCGLNSMFSTAWDELLCGFLAFIHVAAEDMPLPTSPRIQHQTKRNRCPHAPDPQKSSDNILFTQSHGKHISPAFNFGGVVRSSSLSSLFAASSLAKSDTCRLCLETA